MRQLIDFLLTKNPRVVAPNIVLLAKAFRHQFVIPDFLGFTKDIEEIYWNCKSNRDGKVAAYIPQLQRVNPGMFLFAINSLKTISDDCV